MVLRVRQDLFGIPVSDIPWWSIFVTLLSMLIIAATIIVSFKYQGRREGWRTAFFVLLGYAMGLLFSCYFGPSESSAPIDRGSALLREMIP